MPSAIEPTFYLNELEGDGTVDASGIKTTTDINTKPSTTVTPHGIVTNVSAIDAQKWFQITSGDANHTKLVGVKSNTPTAFTKITDAAKSNTTLAYFQQVLQNDYLENLSLNTFGYKEGYDLFNNVTALTTAYDKTIDTATNASNKLMNDTTISERWVGGIDVSKKLADTILNKYPERFELKYGAKIVEANSSDAYDSSKPPGAQIVEGIQVYDLDHDVSGAIVSVTFEDQNTISDIKLTTSSDGYHFGDNLLLCASGTTLSSSLTDASSGVFVQYSSILDIQASIFNGTANLEDIILTGADISNNLFLPNLTSDIPVIQTDSIGNVLGREATVDVSCNTGAIFNQVDVNNRGYGYVEGNSLNITKKNASINFILSADDAVRLNLGDIDGSGTFIDSSNVFNDGASGKDDVSGAIVTVVTNTSSGTDVSGLTITTTSSVYAYALNDNVTFTNTVNNTQTIDISLTVLDAARLNNSNIINTDSSGVTNLGNAEIVTRSFYGVSDNETLPIGLVTQTGSDASGAIVEITVSDSGTVIDKITVRSGKTSGNNDYTDGSGNLTITNIVNGVLDASQTIVFDASGTADLCAALNTGAGYVYDTSGILTSGLEGGIVFMTGLGYVRGSNDSSAPDASCATVTVTTNASNDAITTIVLNAVATGAGDIVYYDGSSVTITSLYRTIDMSLNNVDADILNGLGTAIEQSTIGSNTDITSDPIFTSGAIGYATCSGVADASRALIRVDTNNNDTSIVKMTVLSTYGGVYTDTSNVSITNSKDSTQRITFDISGVLEATELSGTSDTKLDGSSNNITPVPTFKGGIIIQNGIDSSFNGIYDISHNGYDISGVPAVQNGVRNYYSEAQVHIKCNEPATGDVGTIIESITMISAAPKPTVGSGGDIYYKIGDEVTFTYRDTSGNGNFDITYVIEIPSLTHEQATVLNGTAVGINIPLLPGDNLVLKSTINSPSGVDGQPTFTQSFLTYYSLS